MTFQEAAMEVLRRVGKPLSAQKIAQLAVKHNLLTVVGKTPEETMATRLEVATQDEYDLTAPLVRAGKSGVYELREWGGQPPGPAAGEAFGETEVPRAARAEGGGGGGRGGAGASGGGGGGGGGGAAKAEARDEGGGGHGKRRRRGGRGGKGRGGEREPASTGGRAEADGPARAPRPERRVPANDAGGSDDAAGDEGAAAEGAAPGGGGDARAEGAEASQGERRRGRRGRRGGRRRKGRSEGAGASPVSGGGGGPSPSSLGLLAVGGVTGGGGSGGGGGVAVVGAGAAAGHNGGGLTGLGRVPMLGGFGPLAVAGEEPPGPALGVAALDLGSAPAPAPAPAIDAVGGGDPEAVPLPRTTPAFPVQNGAASGAPAPDVPAGAARIPSLVEAAYAVMKQSGSRTPLHFHRIAELGRVAGIRASGPAIHAALLADNERRAARGLRPRFVPGEKGEWSLGEWSLPERIVRLEQRLWDLTRELRVAAHAEIASQLRALDPPAIQQLMALLLERQGYGDIRLASRSSEGNVALVATLHHGLARVGTAVVLRTGGGPATREHVRDVRARLPQLGASQGVIMALPGVSADARLEADAPGAPVRLLDAEAIADLCVAVQLGVQVGHVTVVRPDLDFFTELRRR
jgi:restriction endonuclease Mrr